MRLAILIAAFGLVATVPALSPVFAPAAEAQAASQSVEEQQLQAQLVALAQAGDTAGAKALVATKIRQGKAAMVAKVVKSIATMGANMASNDPSGAAALVNIAVVIAADQAVSGADDTVENAVGDAAKAAVVTMSTSSNPNAVSASASIQSNVATNGSGDTRSAYLASSGETIDSTQQAIANQVGQVSGPMGANVARNVVTVNNGGIGDLTVGAIVVTENPNQSGSAV